MSRSFGGEWENVAGVVCGRGAGEADADGDIVDGFGFCCVGYRLHNNIVPPSSLGQKADYYLFKVSRRGSSLYSSVFFLHLPSNSRD